MRRGTLIGLSVAAVCLLQGPAFAQTNVVTNGSFESGLTGWTVGTSFQGAATGTCSYNGVVAPGTETLTSVAGFPATDGTNIALGSVRSSLGTAEVVSCVLYQDVAIPTGATTATLSFDIGIKDTPGNNLNNEAALGIYSTSTVPSYVDLPLPGSSVRIAYANPSDVTLQSRTFGSTIDVSSLAGTTVRFAIINAANMTGHEVIGVDNVRLLVTVPPPAPVPALPAWAFGALALVLAAGAQFVLRRG